MTRDERPMLWVMNADHSISPAATTTAWSEAMFGPGAHRRVAKDQVGPFFISTVFSGIDIAMHGPPQVFETMVFHDRAPLTARQARRSSSHAEALEIHAALVEHYRVVYSSSSSSHTSSGVPAT